MLESSRASSRKDPAPHGFAGRAGLFDFLNLLLLEADRD
jgi:hypothetical protein